MRFFFPLLVFVLVSVGAIAGAAASCIGLRPEQAFARAQAIDQQRPAQRGAVPREEYLGCLRVAEESTTFGAFAVTLQSKELRNGERYGDALSVLARYPASNDMVEARADFFRELLEVARGEREAKRADRACESARVAFRVFGPAVTSYRDSVDPLIAACGVGADLPEWPGAVTGGISLHDFLEASLAQGGVPCGVLFMAFRTAPRDAALKGRDQEALLRQCRFGGILLGGAAADAEVVRVDGKEWRTDGGRVLGIQESSRVAVQIPPSRPGQRAEERVYRVASGTMERQPIASNVPTTLRVTTVGQQRAEVLINGQRGGVTGQAISVTPGWVTVIARAPGYGDQQQRVEVIAEQSNDLELPRLRLDLSAQCRQIAQLPAAIGNMVGDLNATTSERLPDNRPAVLYRLYEKRGFTTTVRMTGKGVGDPFLIVIDPTVCNLLAEDDDGGGGRAARLSLAGMSNRTLLLLATSTQASTLGGYELVVESSQAEVKQQASAARSAPSPSAEDTLAGDSDGGKRAGLFLLFGVVSAATGYGAYKALTLSHDQELRYEAIEPLPPTIEGEVPPECDVLVDINARNLCDDSENNRSIGGLAALASGLSAIFAIMSLAPPPPDGVAGMNHAARQARAKSESGVELRPIPIPNGIGVSVRF